MDGNPHLQPASDSMRRREVDGRPGIVADLTGTSSVTGEPERVTVVTREAGDGHVLYLLPISPRDQRGVLEDAFERMISNEEMNDRAVHPASAR